MGSKFLSLRPKPRAFMHTSPSRPSRHKRVHFDLTTLQIFIVTAELGGVTRAADRLHIAAAAASRRIIELEAQFGLPLFERRPHGMTHHRCRALNVGPCV